MTSVISCYKENSVSAPSQNDAACCKVIRYAALFFLLASGAAAATLHVYGLSQYFVAPIASGLLSLIALAVSYCGAPEPHVEPIHKPKHARKSSVIDDASFAKPLDPIFATWLEKPLNMASVTTLFKRTALVEVNAPILIFGEVEELGSFTEAQLSTLQHNGYNECYDFLSNSFHVYSTDKIVTNAKEFKTVSEFYTDAETPNMEEGDKIKVMKLGLWRKFTEMGNGRLTAQLLSTGTRFLYYGASDKFWGCILRPMSKPKKDFDSVALQGQNLLGKLLMELREILRQKAAQLK